MFALRGCPLFVLIGAAAVSGSSCGVEGQGALAGSVGSNMQRPAGAGGSGGSAGSSSSGSGGIGAPATTAGSGGSAGASASAAPVETTAFADDLEGFRINYYCSGNPPACSSVMDAASEADAGVADAGEAPAAGNDFVSAEFDADVGEPAPGSARITVQFSADGQLVDFARNFGDGMTPGLNLTGKVITARAFAEAGGAPTVVAKMYIKTSMTYSYADSGETPLPAGVWTTLRYQTPTYVNDAAVYDIADVREIGIEILGRGTTAVTPTVVHIDTIEY